MGELSGQCGHGTNQLEPALVHAFKAPFQVPSASKIEAWKRFCGEIGVPAELPDVLRRGERANAPAIATDIACEIGECEPDADLVEIEMQALRDYWSNLVAKIS